MRAFFYLKYLSQKTLLSLFKMVVKQICLKTQNEAIKNFLNFWRLEKMKKSTYVLIIGSILLIVVLNYLPNKKVPKVPVDNLHNVDKKDEVCLGCHGEGKQSPLPKKHPIKTLYCVSEYCHPK